MAKTKYPEFESMTDALTDEDLPYVPPVHPDRTGPGIGMNKQELCETFGVSRYEVDRACEMKNAPVIQRGSKFKPWIIASGDMLLFLIEQHTKTVADPDLSNLRRNQIRLVLQQTEKLELKNAASRRELVTIDEVLTVYREEADLIRTHLRAVPDAIVKALGSLAQSDPVGRKDPAVVTMVVQDVINDALCAISEGESHVKAA